MEMREFQEWVAERNRYDARSIGRRLAELEGRPETEFFVSDSVQPANAGHLLNGALGMTTESAELLDVVKKVVVHEKGVTYEMHDKMVLEVGDALHYAALMCDALGIDLQTAIDRNVDKLKQRDLEDPDHYGRGNGPDGCGNPKQHGGDREAD